MTREEAADLLDNLIGMVEDNQENDYDEALKMAIEALNVTDTNVGDTISRQAAIDALYHVDEYNGRSVEAIKNLPPAQPEQRWIPCSERLPIIKNNIGTRVLITTSWGLVKEAHYCVDHWEVDGISYKLTSATAWMPLPEPWKGEVDEQIR